MSDSRDPVLRALLVLTHMAEGDQDSYGVRALATGLSLPVSSVHRTLASLERHGFVRGRDGRYRLGLETLRIAHLIAGRSDTVAVARPLLAALVAECGETALLGLYEPVRGEMLFAASVESDQPLRYVVDQGTWQPVHTGASGQAILAFLPAAEQEAVLERVDAGDPLRDRLAAVRAQGYGCSRGERISGAVGIAAPVFDHTGAVIGDVCVTVPEHRFAPDDEGRLAAQVRACADRVSERLGARTPARSR